jgi:hypothetical protein
VTKPRYALVEPAPPLEPPPAHGFWRKLVRLYGSADPRSLGLLRIVLGSLLFGDVALKCP